MTITKPKLAVSTSLRWELITAMLVVETVHDGERHRKYLCSLVASSLCCSVFRVSRKITIIILYVLKPRVFALGPIFFNPQYSNIDHIVVADVDHGCTIEAHNTPPSFPPDSPLPSMRPDLHVAYRFDLGASNVYMVGEHSRCAPFRHYRGAKACDHTTTPMHNTTTPPPPTVKHRHSENPQQDNSTGPRK